MKKREKFMLVRHRLITSPVAMVGRRPRTIVCVAVMLTTSSLPVPGTSPGTVVCAGLPVPGSVATMLRHNRIINLPVAFCCGDGQHTRLRPAVNVRRASDTPLPPSGGKMLFLGVLQTSLVAFDFCSVSLMIFLKFTTHHLLLACRR